MRRTLPGTQLHLLVNLSRMIIINLIEKRGKTFLIVKLCGLQIDAHDYCSHYFTDIFIDIIFQKLIFENWSLKKIIQKNTF